VPVGPLCSRLHGATRRAMTYSALAGGILVAEASAQQAAPAGKAAAPPALAFKDVTVIDVTDGRLIPEQTVVIVGNRIQEVGPSNNVRPPQGALVVDARQKYLLPGIWEMHGHIDDEADAYYPLFIANGVTGVREMAQRGSFGSDSFLPWQREIAAGTRVGPRGVGPSADLSQIEIGTENVGHIMDSLKAAGVAFAKYHTDGGDRELFFAIMREARRVGLPVVGHLPTAVTDVEASDSGLRSVEHVEENHVCWPDWPTPLDSAEADVRCAPTAQAYVKNGTWMTVTLAGAKWVDRNVPEAQRFVRMMRRLGVTRFLAGTDWGTGYMSQEPNFRPGVSAVEEVMFIAEALTPLEGIQAGTLNPAKFFQATDSLGTVAPGKLADLILLDGNPLADIRNLMALRAVVANGRYFDRAALDALDPEGLKGVQEYRAELSPAKARFVPR
jgi:imidazolonepropionase-like amidohydrolase